MTEERDDHEVERGYAYVFIERQKDEIGALKQRRAELEAELHHLRRFENGLPWLIRSMAAQQG